MLTMNGIKPNANKIAILGLAKAGKTTLVKIITQEFEIKVSLNPTKLIERTKLEVLGKEIAVWDYGGQEYYRNKYLKEPNHYFNLISIAYYVIDVQDNLTMESNLQYFGDVINILNGITPRPAIVILFHKNDPEMKHTIEQFGVRSQFLKTITPMLEQFKFSLNVYNTTKHDPQSIITAFVQPILHSSDLYQLFTAMLKTFIDTYAFSYAGLLSNQSFELGNALSEQNPLSFYEWEKFLEIVLKRDLTNEDEILQIERPEDSDFKIAYSIVEIPQGDTTIRFQLLIAYERELNWEKKGLTEVVKLLKFQIKKVLVNIDLRSLEIEFPIRKIKVPQ
jgi:hypothetical protein